MKREPCWPMSLTDSLRWGNIALSHIRSQTGLLLVSRVMWKKRRSNPGRFGSWRTKGSMRFRQVNHAALSTRRAHWRVTKVRDGRFITTCAFDVVFILFPSSLCLSVYLSWRNLFFSAVCYLPFWPIDLFEDGDQRCPPRGLYRLALTCYV